MAQHRGLGPELLLGPRGGFRVLGADQLPDERQFFIDHRPIDQVALIP